MVKWSKQQLANRKNCTLLLNDLEPERRLEVALNLLGQRDGNLYIYFIWAKEVNRIKIGVAHKPDKRLQALQTGSPCVLSIEKLVPRQTWQAEMGLHKLYAHLNTYNEWFEGDDELWKLFEKMDERGWTS